MIKELKIKENLILFYVTIITGLYPIFLTSDKISKLLNVTRTPAVALHYILVFLFFFIIPSLIIKLYFKENLKDYGLNFNNVKKGSIFISILLPLLIISLWISSKTAPFQKEYPLAKSIINNYKLFIGMEFLYLLYYIGWEFLFRGFIINGLKKYGILLPILIETVISTILHYTKPDGEIFLALIAGFILGYYAYKFKSIWFTIVIHFLTGILMDIFVIINR